MTAYYNEFDPNAAAWLRNLIDAGHLPPGDVDERSLLDITPDDLRPYTQCHFFAGVGVWPHALRRIGWPDDKPIWTGSCPCQPFSAAGKQLGFDDERHLWPAWFQLIIQRRPSVVVGEQVASALGWLDLIQDDLEAAGYAVGAADLCAPGFPVEGWHESPQHEWLLRAVRHCPDAVVAGQLLDFAAWACGNLGAHDGDHIRQRLYFVGRADADDDAGGRDTRRLYAPEAPPREMRRTDGPQPSGAIPFSGLANGSTGGRGEKRTDGSGGRERNGTQGRTARLDASRGPSGLVDGEQPRLERRAGGDSAPSGWQEPERPVAAASDIGGADAAHRGGGFADWLYCRDGKWRPVRPGTFPLANEAPARVGRLRAYGNALDAETVVAFLASVRDVLEEN